MPEHAAYVAALAQVFFVRSTSKGPSSRADLPYRVHMLRRVCVTSISERVPARRAARGLARAKAVAQMLSIALRGQARTSLRQRLTNDGVPLLGGACHTGRKAIGITCFLISARTRATRAHELSTANCTADHSTQRVAHIAPARRCPARPGGATTRRPPGCGVLHAHRRMKAAVDTISALFSMDDPQAPPDRTPVAPPQCPQC